MSTKLDDPCIKFRRLLDLYISQEGRCYICGIVMLNYAAGGKRVNMEASATFEHIRPISGGGTNAVSNLVLTCRMCNNRRGNGELKHYSDRFRAQVNILCMHLEQALHQRAMDKLQAIEAEALMPFQEYVT